MKKIKIKTDTPTFAQMLIAYIITTGGSTFLFGSLSLLFILAIFFSGFKQASSTLMFLFTRLIFTAGAVSLAAFVGGIAVSVYYLVKHFRHLKETEEYFSVMVTFFVALAVLVGYAFIISKFI